jgi:hypothetical protein
MLLVRTAPDQRATPTPACGRAFLDRFLFRADRLFGLGWLLHRSSPASLMTSRNYDLLSEIYFSDYYNDNTTNLTGEANIVADST